MYLIFVKLPSSQPTTAILMLLQYNTISLFPHNSLLVLLLFQPHKDKWASDSILPNQEKKNKKKL